jgi:outer membrane protein assembly factor BamB
VPVFPPGFSDTENSLIGYDGTFFVENNFGYASSFNTSAGTVTPGLAWVRFDKEPCPGRKVWENERVTVPSVVSKLSLANGLLYTYTLETLEGREDWYVTTVDAETGKVAWKVFAGTGQSYDNHYSALCVGPGGTVYVPVLAGILAVRQA